jgi:hypothetical protein
MPLPVIGGVVRCSVVGKSQGGGPWVNVWHWMYADGASSPGSSEIDALHAVFGRFYTGTIYPGGNTYLAACATNTTVERVDYTVLNGTSLGYTKTLTGAGAGGASTMPAEVSPVLTLRTNTRGRRYRGRLYLPPPAQSATVIDSSGKLLTAVANAIITQATGMASAASAIQWKPVVASYGKSLIKDPNDKYDKIEVTWTPFATPVTTWTMDLVLDVQRRRKA